MLSLDCITRWVLNAKDSICITLLDIMYNSDRWESDFRVQEVIQKMGLMQVEQGFFLHFLAYLMIFQSGFFKFGKKNLEKPCSTCIKPIF